MNVEENTMKANMKTNTETNTKTNTGMKQNPLLLRVDESNGTQSYSYHRLLRAVQNYQPWKPFLFLVLTAGLWLVCQFLVLVAQLLFSLATHTGNLSVGSAITELSRNDTQRPVSVFFAFLDVCLILPAMLLAQKICGFGPVGRLFSVAGRMRWKFLFICFALALLVKLGEIAVYLVAFILTGMKWGEALFRSYTGLIGTDTLPEQVSVDYRMVLVSLLLVLAFVPLQTLAEEVAFRGVIMQAIGSWIPSAVLCALLSSVVFAVLHPYDIVGNFSVGAFGFVVGYLVYRTGGLEAAWALHMVNNFYAFTLLSTGVLGVTEQAAIRTQWADLIGQTISALIYFAVVIVVVRKFESKGTFVRTLTVTPEKISDTKGQFAER